MKYSRLVCLGLYTYIDMKYSRLVYLRLVYLGLFITALPNDPVCALAYPLSALIFP